MFLEFLPPAVEEGFLVQLAAQEVGQNLQLCEFVDVFDFISDHDYIFLGVFGDGVGYLVPDGVEEHGGVDEEEPGWGEKYL